MRSSITNRLKSGLFITTSIILLAACNTEILHLEYHSNGTISVYGSAPANQNVTITFPDQSTIVVKANNEGKFGPATSSTPQYRGVITAITRGQPEPYEYIYNDDFAPQSATLNVHVTQGGRLSVNGLSEASSKVMITFPDNTTKTALTNLNGRYSNIFSQASQSTGVIKVKATDINGNSSADHQVDVISRPSPMMEITTDKRLMIDDFILPSHTSARIGIQNALNQAIASGVNTALVFGNRIYHVDGTLYLRNYRGSLPKNLLIQGQAATQLLKTGPFTSGPLLTINDSQNIIFDNLQFGLSVDPYSVSTVNSINGSSIVVTADTTYLSPNHDSIEAAKENWGYFIKSDSAQVAHNTDITFGVSNVTQLGANQYRIELSKAATNIKTGHRFIRNARNNGNPLVMIRGSDQITFKNIELLNSTSGGFNVALSGAINYYRVNAVLKPGKVRTLNADFFHLKSNRYGPWINQCKIEGIGDDIVNSSYSMTKISKLLNNSTFSLDKTWSHKNFQVGDKLVFFNHELGQIIDKRKVTNINASGHITVNAPLKNIVISSASSRHTSVINTSFGGGEISQSEFKNSRRHGLLMRYKDIMIKDNLFSGLGSSSIALSNENGLHSAFSENGFPYNVTIQGNTFSNNGFTYKYLSDQKYAQVSIYTETIRTDEVSKNNHIEGLKIDSNTFEGSHKKSIYAANTIGTQIICNQFSTKNPQYNIALRATDRSYIAGNSNNNNKPTVYDMTNDNKQLSHIPNAICH